MAEVINIDAFIHMIVSVGDRWLYRALNADDIVAFVGATVNLLKIYETTNAAKDASR